MCLEVGEIGDCMVDAIYLEFTLANIYIYKVIYLLKLHT